MFRVSVNAVNLQKVVILMMIWKLIVLLQKRLQILLSIFVSFLSMLFDALSLVMIYEFVSALERRSDYVSLESVIDLVGLQLPEIETDIWALYVGVIIICANIIRAINTRLIIHITYDCELKINQMIFQRKILGPYDRFVDESQFDDQKEILNEANLVVVQGIMSLTYIFLGFFQITGITVGLIFTDPINSLSLFSGVAVIYMIVFGFLLSSVKQASLVRSEADTMRIGLLNEVFANIKQIKVSRDEKPIVGRLFHYAKLYTNANAKAKWLGIAPRFIIEGVILAGIAFFAAILLKTNGSVQLPSLASVTLMAVSAAKLIPAAQKIYNSCVNIGYSADATMRVIKKISELASDQNLIRDTEVHVRERFVLEVKNLDYIYPGQTDPAIVNLSFVFFSGRLNYLVGQSGSGKSTVCDLITGLLPSQKGMLIYKSLDSGLPLKPIVRYIPQDSFLMTGSVAFNLLGTETSSETKLQRARELLSVFNLAKDKDDADQMLGAEVKEFGRNFSGGQKQRLAVIRGILQEANVLILDEPFSALDESNTRSILHELETLMKPEILIIIITHDKTLLEHNEYIELVKRQKIN